MWHYEIDTKNKVKSGDSYSKKIKILMFWRSYVFMVRFNNIPMVLCVRQHSISTENNKIRYQTIKIQTTIIFVTSKSSIKHGDVVARIWNKIE